VLILEHIFKHLKPEYLAEGLWGDISVPLQLWSVLLSFRYMVTGGQRRWQVSHNPAAKADQR